MDAIGYGRQFAGIYDEIFPAGPVADQTAAWLADLHLGEGLPTLELGVGTGRIALPLSERVGEVVGVDASPDMLNVLRRALAVMPRPVVPVPADIRQYEDERRYGLVYCVCGTLSMLLNPADQQRVIEICASMLAPDAALVIETHNPSAVEAMHEGRVRDTFFTPYPDSGAGLLTHSIVDVNNRVWSLSHVWFEGSSSRIVHEISRLTTPEDIDAYANRAGLQLEARYGDWFGTPFIGAEPMQVSLYRR
jgi:SAM-dependent methyltransferase